MPVNTRQQSGTVTTMDAQTPQHVVERFNTEVIQDGSRASFEQLVAPGFVNRSAPPGAPDNSESLWNFLQTGLRPGLSNLRVAIHDQVAEGDKVTTRKTITGVHSGELMGIAPTGRSVTIDVIDIVRVEDGRYAEHWGVNTLPGVLAQLQAG